MRFFVHPGRLRALILAATAAGALGIVPAGAQAATVSVSSGALVYAAAAGEANHVTVAPWGLALKVTDTGVKGSRNSTSNVTLTPGSGCMRLSSSAASCLSTVSGITATLGDGNDFFDGSTVGLATAVSGGAGADTLSTGSGNDTLTALDGAADVVACGAGTDAWTADPVDSVAADCEAVQQPAPSPGTDAPAAAVPAPAAATPSGGSPTGGDPNGSAVTPTEPAGTGTGTTPDPAAGPSGQTRLQGISANANALPPSIPAQTVTVSASGVASVQIVCPADSGGCRGTVALELPVSGSARVVGAAKHVAGPGKQPALRLGQTRFKAKAGTKPIVRIRLSKRGRQRILRNVRRSRGRGTRARIVITTRSADGKAVVTSQDITIANERRKPPPKRRRGRK